MVRTTCVSTITAAFLFRLEAPVVEVQESYPTLE